MIKSAGEAFPPKSTRSRGVGEAVDDHARQTIAPGVDQPAGVGQRIKLEHLAAQGDRSADLAREGGLVDGFIGVGCEYKQRKLCAAGGAPRLACRLAQ